MLKIAIDASRTTIARRTGTERYALALLQAMLRLETRDVAFTLYFRDPPSDHLLPESSAVRQQVIPFPRLWTHVRFAGALWQDRPDVVFVPAHALPVWFPGPAVVTVHDLGYHYFPEAHPWLARTYLEWSTPASARRATLIIADSEATRRDLVRLYHVSENKIRVIYPGADPTLRRVDSAEVRARLREKYGLPERYLLFLGTLQPRKNIGRLVAAYRRSGLWETEQIGLALGGARGWLYNPAWTAGVPGVVETGYIADEDVAGLYSGALALVFPSLYEGFGFPVLEAMQCGLPVITSNTSSLPEVAGNAALLVDPLSEDAIVEAMQALVRDEALRERLVQAGYEQARQFTWERAAQQTLAVLREAAQMRA